MKAEVLGTRMYVYNLVVIGKMTVEGWGSFLDAVIKAIGMSPVHQRAHWKYPESGLGGVGHTLVQPITESFVCLDTWEDHRGAYLVICSCRKFEFAKVRGVCKRMGLPIHQEVAHNMGMPDD